MTHAGPIPDSYWAEPGLLLAGPYPFLETTDRESQRDVLRALLDVGVRTMIDLRTPAEPPGVRALLGKLSDEVAWIGVPVLDGTAPTAAELITILDSIDAAHARGRCVYVHCQGGRGRTGTVVACWWIRHGHFDAPGAFAELGRRRVGQPHGEHPSPETGQQLRRVRGWRQSD